MSSLNPNLKPPAMQELEDFLAKRLKGQPQAIEALAKVYADFKSGVGKFNERDLKKPIGIFLFLGPSCTGKTQIGRLLAQKFHGTPKAVTMIDCVSFQEKHEISKLIGAPPGYIGHGDKPLLSKEKLYAQIPNYQIKSPPPNQLNETQEKQEDKPGESIDFNATFTLYLNELALISEALQNIDHHFSKLRKYTRHQKQLQRIKNNLEFQRNILQSRKNILTIAYTEAAQQLVENWHQEREPSSSSASTLVGKNDGKSTLKKTKTEASDNSLPSIPVKATVKEEPILVIIFDEIEKANESVWKFLLQLMREGRAILGSGEEVDLSRSFIILTANIGSKLIGRAAKGIAKIGFCSSAGQVNLEKFIRTELKKIFSQEFLNRLDAIIIFNILSSQNFREIFALELQGLYLYLKKISLKLTVSQSVEDFILEETAKHPEEQVKSLQDCFKKYLVSPIGNLLSTGQLISKKQITAVFDFNTKQIVFKT